MSYQKSKKHILKYQQKIAHIEHHCPLCDCTIMKISKAQHNRSYKHLKKMLEQAKNQQESNDIKQKMSKYKSYKN